MIVWLVISSYRNDQEVLGILNQVDACRAHLPFERILIVDSEGTGVLPRALDDPRWRNVIYRSYEENLGSGANLRERLQIAAEGGADYAYALNHDGKFDPDVVKALLKAAASVDNLGAAYPLSCLTSIQQFNLAGTRELPWPAKLVSSAPEGPLIGAFWSSSNGALYSMAPVKAGIIPWGALWMGWEDLEYGWRLADHGYRQVIVCDAIFQDNYEYIATRFGRVIQKPAWRTYYNIRNLILAIRRSRNRPKFYLVLIYRVILECGMILIARRDKWKRLRLLWTGVTDGVKGVEGERHFPPKSQKPVRSLPGSRAGLAGAEHRVPSRRACASGLPMTRIMHVITGLAIGGAETTLLKLLSVTSGDFEPVVVSLTDEGTIGPFVSRLGIPVYSLRLDRTVPHPIRTLSIVSLARRLRPQLIQGWMPHGNLMASLAGGFSETRPPVMWSIHQSLYSLSSEPWRTRAAIRLATGFSRKTAAIIYVSRTSKKQHEALGYHASNGLVIPNGIDCVTFRPDEAARREVRAELGIENDAILVGLVARYHPMKDHATFLRAAAAVSRVHPSVRFALVGLGTREHPAILALIRELQLQERVLLLGERQDMPRLTAAFDIACSSSWTEAFSISLGEAMACGIPCVVTDVGDSAYMVADTGISVPPARPEAFAQALCHLIESEPAYRRQLGMAARRRVEEEFSLPVIVRRYELLYQQHVDAPEPIAR
jgi:glycosyltransferase involved in cell wall biosynthesis/GT2 family glycosyltransferase